MLPLQDMVPMSFRKNICNNLKYTYLLLESITFYNVEMILYGVQIGPFAKA